MKGVTVRDSTRRPRMLGGVYPKANALVEANNRESKTINAIALLADTMASDRYR